MVLLPVTKSLHFIRKLAGYLCCAALAKHAGPTPDTSRIHAIEARHFPRTHADHTMTARPAGLCFTRRAVATLLGSTLALIPETDEDWLEGKIYLNMKC